MNIYWQKRGQHIHMRVFHNGKLGDLVCRDSEFPDLQAAMPGCNFVEELLTDSGKVVRAVLAIKHTLGSTDNLPIGSKMSFHPEHIPEGWEVLD